MEYGGPGYEARPRCLAQRHATWFLGLVKYRLLTRSMYLAAGVACALDCSGYWPYARLESVHRGFPGFSCPLSARGKFCSSGCQMTVIQRSTSNFDFEPYLGCWIDAPLQPNSDLQECYFNMPITKKSPRHLSQRHPFRLNPKDEARADLFRGASLGEGFAAD